MAAVALTHPQLMRESERRIERAANSRDAREAAVAVRLLDDRDAFRHWDTEHARYMRAVAHARHAPGQVAALRELALRLIHRKALFEYQRTEAPCGHERRRIVQLLHRSLAYTEAVVAEHRTFIRASCSTLCATYIATTLLEDKGALLKYVITESR